MNAEQRQEIERKVVRHLIRTMKKNGWALAWVHDGESKMNISTETEAMDHIFSVDAATVAFRKAMPFPSTVSVVHTAYIVLGNDGWDCIADHTTSDRDQYPSDDFEDVMDGQVSPYCEGFGK